MITTIQVITGIGCFGISLIFVLRRHYKSPRLLTERLIELTILSFAVGAGIGVGISAIYYSLTNMPFPGETLDSIRTPIAIGALCSIIGPAFLFAHRLKKR